MITDGQSHAVLDQLRAWGGIARIVDLQRAGCSVAAIRRLVRAGALAKPGRGVVEIPGVSEDLRLTVLAAADLTCVSALRRYGVRGMRAVSAPHMTRTARPPRAAVVHRAPHSRQRPGLARLEDALVASLTCVGELEARILLESALGQRLCSKGQLLGRLPGNRNARLRDMVDEASECADSPLETLARLALRNAGLTVRTQVHIPGVGRVDMVVEDQVVIELDGYQFHSSREAFANDRRRSNVLAARGTPCLRFTYDDVVHRPDELVQTTKATLASCRGR